MAGKNDTLFDGPPRSSYWNFTDSSGAFHEVSLQTTPGEAWERVVVETDGKPVVDFTWGWTEVAGGWVIDSAVATYHLNDGSEQAVFAAHRLGTVVASVPAKDVSEHLAALTEVLRSAMAIRDLGAQGGALGDCEEEWYIFRLALANATYWVARAAVTKSPWDITRAAGAVVAAGRATGSLVSCERQNDEDLQP